MAEEEKKDLTEKKDTEKKKKDSSAIRVSIEPSDPKDFIPRLSALQDKSLNMSRMSEQGIISEKTGAAVVVREDGQINLTSGKYSQFKISPLGRTTETSLESVTMTNRKKFNTDEFIINEHKLNPLLWEYTDFKETKLLTNQHAIVGNLCMMGSVLVKAWEPNLKRYVLIRRPWRGPIFGNFMNVPEINPALGVHDPLKLNEDILALSNKGYQVNGVIKDAKTLIGKQGEDRPGINRGKDALSSGGGSSGGGGSSSGGSSSGGEYKGTNSGSLGGGNIDPFDCWRILRKAGYSEIASAAILGNIQQESSFNSGSDNGSYKGLAQWDQNPGGRWENLCAWVQSQGRDPMDGASQIDYLIYEANNIRYPEECGFGPMNTFSDIAGANHQWVKYYEGATNGDGTYQQEAERRNYAQDFYEQFKGRQ